MKKFLTIATFLTAPACLSNQAMAQDADALSDPFAAENFGVEAGFGTMGLTIAPEYEVNDNFRVRVPITLGSLSASAEDEDGNEIDGQLSTNSIGVMADYYLGTAGVRFSGGLVFGGYDISGEVVNPTVDGLTFNGTFKLGLRQAEEIAPALAIGFTTKQDSPFGGYFEIGARLSSFELYESGAKDVLTSADMKTLNDSLDEVNDEIKSNLSMIPFIGFGIRVNF